MHYNKIFEKRLASPQAHAVRVGLSRGPPVLGLSTVFANSAFTVQECIRDRPILALPFACPRSQLRTNSTYI